MKKYLFLLILFLCSVTTLWSQVENNLIAQIPIMAYWGVDPKESTYERFLELRESGITHNFSFYKDEKTLVAAMESAQKAGVKMIIRVPALNREPERIVNLFKNHPALAGYYLSDEPKVDEFPEIEQLMKRIQKIDNIHFCYVNFLANDFSEKHYGKKTYKKHLEQFITKTPLPIVSFDFYPIIKNRLGSRVVQDIWYRNLEFFSTQSRKAGKPFWAFARTVAYRNYPVPTLEEIRLQVFCNLAYGAQGIQYFTYWTPEPTERTDFHNAPIEYNTRKRTKIYDYVKQINGEIKSLSHVFLGAKVLSVSHTGTKIPTGTTRLKGLPNVITKLNTEGLGAVVSVLKNGNKNYLVVVNRDIKNVMSLNIEGDNRLNRILKTGVTVKANSSEKKISVPPGDVVIFGW